MRDGKGLLGLHLVRSRYEATAADAGVVAAVWESHQDSLPMRQDDFLDLVMDETGMEQERAKNAIKSAVTAKSISLDAQTGDVLPAS